MAVSGMYQVCYGGAENYTCTLDELNVCYEYVEYLSACQRYAMNECVVSCRYDKVYSRVCHSYTWLKKKNPIKAKGLNFSSKFQKARYLRAEGEKQLTLTSHTRIQESR